MFPRRRCETVFATYQLNLAPNNGKGFHEDMSWNDIRNTLRDLINEERETPKDKNYPLYSIIKSRIQVVPTAHAIMCIYKIKNLLEIAPLGLDYNST